MVEGWGWTEGCHSLREEATLYSGGTALKQSLLFHRLLPHSHNIQVFFGGEAFVSYATLYFYRLLYYLR